MKKWKIVVVLLIASLTNYTNCSDCSKGCAGCVKNKCIACFDRSFDKNKQCLRNKKIDPKCDMYYPRGNTQVCVKCAKGYYLDNTTTRCKKAEFPIPNCVDMVKIDDTIYCNVCEGGFPSEEYAFTACSKFSTNEVVGS